MSLLLLFAGAGAGVDPAGGGTIEFGFGSTWQTAPGSISWEDVTDYVLSTSRLNTTRGASSARGQADVGSCSFGLLNSDRRFDPTYAAGPYFGDLIPGVPVRVTMAPSGGTPAVIFRGHVASWPQRYDIGNTFAFVPIQAYDGFDKLSRAKIPRSVLEATVLADNPTAFWPLDEASGTVMIDRTAFHRDGEYVFGTTPSVDQDGVTGQNFATDEFAESSSYGAVVVPDPGTVPSSSDQWAFEALVFPGEASDGQARTIVQQSWGSEPYAQWGILLYLDSGSWKVHALDKNLVATLPSGAFANGPAHLVVQDANSVGVPDVQIWCNGDQLATAAGTPSGITRSSYTRIAGPNDDFECFISSVAVYDAAIDPAAHATAALGPLDGQTTDERIDWILDEIGWPAGLVDLEPGRTLGAASFEPGDKALDYLRMVDASEDGRLFITANGTLRFLDRYWRFEAAEATVSQATFTDAGDPDEGGYAEFQLDLDDELLVNTARFTRRGGSEQVATDTVSVALYGEAELQKSDLLLGTDNEVRALAQWVVSTSSTPQPRCPTIRVPLHRYTAAAANDVLALDLGYRVTVVRTPQGVGDPIELDLIVDGIAHDIDAVEWWVTLFVSPVPDSSLTLFILDTSELDGVDVLAP